MTRSYDSYSMEGDVGLDLKRSFGGYFEGDILGFLTDRPSHWRLLPAPDAPMVFSYPTTVVQPLFPACFALSQAGDRVPCFDSPP